MIQEGDVSETSRNSQTPDVHKTLKVYMRSICASIRLRLPVGAASTVLKLADEDGDRETGDQRGGQFESVVRMELQFRQQVAARDAKK